MLRIMICLMVAFLMVPLVLTTEWFQEGNPNFLESHNYDSSLKNDPNSYKFIKFFSPFCRYCRFLKIVLQQIDKQSHRNDIIFYDFNCHNHPTKCQELGIFSYPYVMVYGPQGNQINALSGYYPKQIIKNFIQTSMPERLKVQQTKKQQPKQEIKKQVLQQIKQEHKQEQKQQKIQQNKQIKVEEQKVESKEAKPKIQQNVNTNKKVEQHDNQKIKPNGTVNKIQEKVQQTENIKLVNKNKDDNDREKNNNQKYAQDIIKAPQDIQEVEQKQIQQQILKEMKTQTIKIQQKQRQSETVTYGFIKIALYLLVAIIGGYYLHSIMKNEQKKNLINPKTHSTQHQIEGQMKTSNSNKTSNKEQILEQQYQLTQVRDEDL